MRTLIAAVLTLVLLQPSAAAAAIEDAIRAQAEGRFDEARTLYRKAADAGDLRALHLLATMYAEGAGGAADHRRAAALYDEAAAQGYSDSQYALGLMAELGLGGPADLSAAAGWYERAAAQDHPGALGALGRLLAEGRGRPKDVKQAAALLERGVAGGDPGAMFILGALLLPGTPPDVTQDVARGLALFDRAARLGHVNAAYNLGVLWFRGEGVEKQDMARARAYFAIAAAGGDGEAQMVLAAMLSDGKGGNADPYQALIWLSRAEARGVSDAALRAKLEGELGPARAAEARAEAARPPGGRN